MAISRELVSSVRQRVAVTPWLSIARLARELKTPEADVITALPLHMRMRARPENSVAIWEAATGWSGSAVLLSGENGRAGPLPGARLANGRLEQNVFRFAPEGDTALPDLDLSALGSIWFVSRTWPAGESHSVRFFDPRGDHKVSIYLGRDASGRPDPGLKAAYEALREKFGVTPVPRNRCAGCRNCSCDKRKTF